MSRATKSCRSRQTSVGKGRRKVSDLQNFRNYSGVEESEITETELQGHLDKGHLAAFDDLDALREFVQGEFAQTRIIRRLFFSPGFWAFHRLQVVMMPLYT